jgi:hypothetical protein
MSSVAATTASTIAVKSAASRSSALPSATRSFFGVPIFCLSTSRRWFGRARAAATNPTAWDNRWRRSAATKKSTHRVALSLFERDARFQATQRSRKKPPAAHRRRGVRTAGESACRPHFDVAASVLPGWRKPGGMTPMTVYGSSSTRTRRPMTCGSDPNWRFQRPSLMRTPSRQPGTHSACV